MVIADELKKVEYLPTEVIVLALDHVGNLFDILPSIGHNDHFDITARGTTKASTSMH